MAARVLLQRRAAPVTAALVLGGVALAPRPAFAEAPDSRSSKKPIYDDFELPSTTTAIAPPPSKAVAAAPEQPTTATLPLSTSGPVEQEVQEDSHKSHGPSPTDRLAVQIGKGRLFAYEYALAAENAVNRTMDRAFNLEQSFTNTIASLAPPRESGEKLMPGAVYVLVAAMAGSIVTRRSNILFRAAAPLAFGVGAGWTVLPVTMRNVSDLTWHYEQKFPAVAESHLKVREGISRGVSFARVHSELGVRYMDEKVTDVRETMEGWVKKGK